MNPKTRKRISENRLLDEFNRLVLRHMAQDGLTREDAAKRACEEMREDLQAALDQELGTTEPEI